jgi:hypothetical protein
MDSIVSGRRMVNSALYTHLCAHIHVEKRAQKLLSHNNPNPKLGVVVLVTVVQDICFPDAASDDISLQDHQSALNAKFGAIWACDDTECDVEEIEYRLLGACTNRFKDICGFFMRPQSLERYGGYSYTQCGH